MALPDVSITLTNGNLGRSAPSPDGIVGYCLSGVAVGGQFALGDVLGPFRSLRAVEAKGITKAYDIANTCLVWHHAMEHFDEAKNSTPIYIQVVAKTVTLADMADVDKDYAAKIVTASNGAVRVVLLDRIPDEGYTPAYADQLDTDVTAAIPKAKALTAALFTEHRPLRVVIGARDFQGDIDALKDLRDPLTGPNANTVCLVLGQSAEVASVHAEAAKYAAVGRVGGRISRVPVQRNIARTKDGPTGTVTAALSDGTLMTAHDTYEMTTLHEKGYIFLRSYADLAGWYFNDDPVACPDTDDFHSLSNGRVIDKAARITYITYVMELHDDVEVDPETGYLPEATAKGLEGILESALDRGMSGEISGRDAFIDPQQDVRITDGLEVQVSVVPSGQIKRIGVTLGMALTLPQ